MGGTILTKSNTIMRVNIDCLDAHERGQSNGWAHVIRKDQECCTKRNQSAIKGYPIHDATHAVLTNTIVHVTTSCSRTEIS